MARRPMTSIVRVLLAVGLSLCTATCRAPLRGDHYGSDGEPFRDPTLAAPVEESSDLAHRLVLIGDAGAPLPADPTLALMGRWADRQPARTTVVYLGDNVYPSGLREVDRERGERILLQQLRATRAHKIFLPGNHDWGFAWNRSIVEGALANQQAFIGEHADLDATFQPRDGCPGPVALDIAEPRPGLPGGLTLVVLDLHWWLLEEDLRPICEGIETTSDFVERLGAELASRAGDNVIVAAHHPIRSGGEHGGFTRGVLADMVVWLLYRVYSAQDLIEPGYREMIGVLSEALSENPPLAMVGGHDHSLQILDGGDEAGMIVVSGAATKVSRVTAIEGTLFAHAHRGFMVLDFHESSAFQEGFLLAQVLETGRGEDPVLTFRMDLARDADSQDDSP